MDSFEKAFNDNTLEIIKKLSYEFFVVQQDPKVKCTCIIDGTSQADPNCPRCLGIGNKIKIKKISGASMDSSAPTTMRTTAKILIARNYYIPITETKLYMDNVIVDGNDLYFVYQNTDMRSFHGEVVYQKVTTIPKKLDSDIFMINFRKIIDR